MENQRIRIITVLSIILTAALVIVSYCGAFVPDTYERDADSMAVQGMGQDVFDLFFIIPLLLVSLFFIHKKKKPAFPIFGGTVLYLLYSFFIYSFGVHFNNLFLLYCVILGSSLYIFILVSEQLKGMHVEEWFDEKTPVHSTGVYFLIIAFMFYVLWLKDIIPAMIQYSVPKSVSECQLLVNPVHVLDIAMVLPGLVIIAISLMRRRQTGYVFAPIFLVFIILLAMALIAMVFMLQIKGISEESSLAAIFVMLALISGIFLSGFMKAMKPLG
jgi:hypothetical protein